jgi:vacuolar-type H+-ATPase subunit C/Vma6
LPKTTRYANVLARIGAERGKLIPETKLKALTESKNLLEFASQLRETSYSERISKISAPVNNRRLERVFKEALIDTYIKVTRNAPKKVIPFLKMYILAFEFENVKTLVKSVAAELTAEEKLARIYLSAEDYLKHRALFEEAAASPDLKTLRDALNKTDYASALTLGLKRYEENGSTQLFDVLLDKMFYEKLWDGFHVLPKREWSHAFFYANIENDSYTLLTLLRGKALNYDANWLRLAIPRQNFNLAKRTVEAIVTAPDLGSTLSLVQKTYYGKFFAKAANPEETVAEAERTFKKAVFHHSLDRRVSETFNVGAPLAFMKQKEVETHNLATISLGVDAKVRAEDIYRLLLLPS